MSEPVRDVEQELVDDIISYETDPLGFTYYAYPWGEGELAKSQGPREWQATEFKAIREHLSNPETRFIPYQSAVASGHGIGKSAFIGMLIGWAMSTCAGCKVIVTANTKTQLDTKTQPEVAKWFKKLINSHWFDVRVASIKARDKDEAASWRADFIPWSEENTEAFAGCHNKGKRILVIFDEASAIARRIWEVTEGALTDEETEILWIAFGNPTQNTGRFRECFGKLGHRWRHRHIDSRTVEGTNKEQLQKWVEDYGEDSDFVKVRVRGEFPSAGSNQFIASDVVASARKFKAPDTPTLPRILSVDVARFGDDQTVIGERQGRQFKILAKLRGQDTVQVAERVIEYRTKEHYDAVVVDGDGIGAGVVDQLTHRGYSRGLFEFHGGERAKDADKYFNRRAEIWGAMADWLKAGAQIPDDPELETDLTSVEYGFSNKGQIQLERKEDMKKRGLGSPDNGDCLAMTFAVQVAPKPKPAPREHYGSAGWMA